VRLEDRDVIEIEFEGFGRPLRNPVHLAKSPESLVAVRPV
jgi:hypothetical protein